MAGLQTVLPQRGSKSGHCRNCDIVHNLCEFDGIRCIHNICCDVRNAGDPREQFSPCDSGRPPGEHLVRLRDSGSCTCHHSDGCDNRTLFDVQWRAEVEYKRRNVGVFTGCKMSLNHQGRAAAITLLIFILLSPVLFPAVAAMNITAADPLVILSAERDYIPFEIWLLLFILAWICLGLSLWRGIEFRDMWAGLAIVLFGALAWLSGYISFNSIQLVIINESAVIQPVQYVFQTSYLCYFNYIMFFLSIVDLVYVIWILYVKPKRDMKLQTNELI